jgi:hypothetical protein
MEREKRLLAIWAEALVLWFLRRGKKTSNDWWAKGSGEKKED